MPDENFVFTLLKIRTILDNDDFETKKEIKGQEDKEINDEIDLQMLHDKINSGHTPSEVEFYFEGPNRNFFLIYSGLNFRILLNFCLPILAHKCLEKICFQFTLKMAIFLHDSYNTGESIHNFLLRQQDDTKKIIHATLTYTDSFSNYIKYFLGDIDAETLDKFDFFCQQKC